MLFTLRHFKKFHKNALLLDRGGNLHLKSPITKQIFPELKSSFRLWLTILLLFPTLFAPRNVSDVYSSTHEVHVSLP